jgi:hypothetical protein
LTDSEKDNWTEFCLMVKSRGELELFMSVLSDLKENRLDDAHPLQTVDGKDVDANTMEDIVEKFYNPLEKEHKTMVLWFVSLLKDYKTKSTTKFLEY